MNAQLKCAELTCAVSVIFGYFIFIRTEIIKAMNSDAHFFLVLNYFTLFKMGVKGRKKYL
jgi:hypothetical protein